MQNVDLQVSYQMLRGRNDLRARDVNTPVDGVRPESGVGTVTQIESTGRSQSDRLSVQARLRLPRSRVVTSVTYTLGKEQNHSNSALSLPSSSLDPDVDWGPVGADIRHRLQAQAQAPVGLGLRATIRISAQSGVPYTMTTGRDDNSTAWSTIALRESVAIRLAVRPSGTSPTCVSRVRLLLVAPWAGPKSARGGRERWRIRWGIGTLPLQRRIVRECIEPVEPGHSPGLQRQHALTILREADPRQQARRVDVGVGFRF